MDSLNSKCRYTNCKLKCKNDYHHKAIYSVIKENKTTQKSNKINYEKLHQFNIKYPDK